MNRRTDERTEYKKRSFKEKQAVKSMALEFMQKRSGSRSLRNFRTPINFKYPFYLSSKIGRTKRDTR